MGCRGGGAIAIDVKSVAVVSCAARGEKSDLRIGEGCYRLRLRWEPPPSKMHLEGEAVMRSFVANADALPRTQRWGAEPSESNSGLRVGREMRSSLHPSVVGTPRAGISPGSGPRLSAGRYLC